jgi:glyceraldehyde 3-phosphate dehydrogenase
MKSLILMVQKLSSPTAIELLTMLLMMKIINELCGIKEAYITTILVYHRSKFAWPTTQDLRRARGAESINSSNYYQLRLLQNFSTLEGQNRWMWNSCSSSDGSLTDIHSMWNGSDIEEINAALKTPHKTA